LTGESLFNCNEISSTTIQQISQEFSNLINWHPESAPEVLQVYFDNNCIEMNDKEYKNFHTKIQKSNMASFKSSLSEDELKFTTMYPIFRGVVNSGIIKDKWGEIQSLSTQSERNSNTNPFQRSRIGRKIDMLGFLLNTPNKMEVIFGEVSSGLGSFGLPVAYRKKKYVDKVKLSVTMRDALNEILKGWNHISDEERKKLIVF
ncbi:10441_t:CDS:2, partial [Ambispora leptoticha]